MKLISILVTFIVLSINFVFSQEDTTSVPAKSKMMEMTKSPSGAIYRSLVLPGWGQIYVESYWKAPIFIAATGTLMYFIIDNQIKFDDYDNRLSGMSKTDDDYQLTKLYREYYRDNRDMSGFYLLAVYILASVDAYVGAHLYDFQVDDNIAMKFSVMAAPIPYVSLSIKF